MSRKIDASNLAKLEEHQGMALSNFLFRMALTFQISHPLPHPLLLLPLPPLPRPPLLLPLPSFLSFYHLPGKGDVFNFATDLIML